MSDKAPFIGRGRGVRISELRSRVTPSTSADAAGEAAGSEKKEDAASVPTVKPVYNTKPSSLRDSKSGTSGRTLKLSANYFKLIRKPKFEFALYRVDFKPEIENAAMRKAFVAHQKELLGGYLFDGQNMIYLTRRLPEQQMKLTIESREGVMYQMIIKNTGAVIEATDSMASQILNVILRRTMDGLNMQLVGRNLYDPENKVKLHQFKVELWPGYITSIRQHEKDVLVCCEVSHKIMRLETIYAILRQCKNDGSSWQDSFKKEIIGATVLTEYNNKTYRVDDVDFNSSPKDTFMQKDKPISYKEYYQTRYKLTIKDVDQPMLVSKPKARDIRSGREEVIYLIPELCRATGLTDKMRSDFTMMRAMADHTQMDPEKRRIRLLDFTKRLHKSEESVKKLEAFNTDIGEQLVEFEGRGLNQEVMVFGDGKTMQNDVRVDWTNGMKMNQMFKTVALKRWMFIYPKKNARESEDFLKSMTEVAVGMKYEMAEPKIVELTDDRTATYVKAIEDILPRDPKLIMIVVPNNAADRYAAIKRLTCVNNAVPTQVIVSKTMLPKKNQPAGLKSIATKVVVQLNCKLGGAPWMIKLPLKGVMTIGFDVNHDSRDRSKSYGAFIASMDLRDSAKFYSGVSAHKEGEELSNYIGVHINAALKEFKEANNGALPERIVMYRDGVGDGQIEYVHSREVHSLLDKLEAIYSSFGDSAPKFSFIIVNKRINTRIFLNKGTGCCNPESGTVVDTTITLPERYDFFLVSQSVRQGTVTPTSYNVIYDTNGLSPDQLQIFTYKQTHLYYNWSGCVRVPAVVQYAHKLALLVGEFLHQPPSEDFNKQLYFL